MATPRSKIILGAKRPLRRANPLPKKARTEKRDAWLREIDSASLFHRLFDVIPGTYFFAKNRKGELMFTCQASLKLYGLKDESAVVGLTDFDLNPPEMARAYINDDERIYATGKPILNRVELWFDANGMPDWFVVNKLPMYSHNGEIVGIMGFSQTYEGRTKLLQGFYGIVKAINHLRANYAQEITVEELAKLAGVSQRQLERKFKASFGVSPQKFLIKTRLAAACRQLRETDQPLSEVALECGFSDQSAFALHFRHHFGLTPSDYRHQDKESGE
jgi:AraC-like DNA-binding protein